MGAKITTCYVLELKEKVFARKFFNTLQELEAEKEKQIFELHHPDYNKQMTDENRLYWIDQYNHSKKYRQVIIEDEII